VTAPINSAYAIADLAYDGIEVVVLAGEQESIARRRRIWPGANGLGAGSTAPCGNAPEQAGNSTNWWSLRGARLGVIGSRPLRFVVAPNSLSITDVLKK